jgi:predicted lactoylglutathione lyase
MSKMIFVNLPVRDLPKARTFYEAVGATNNPQFTDETAACMVFSDAIHVMLLTHDKWAVFTKKPIADAHATSEVMLALSCDSRDAVNATADAAAKAGGVVDVNPPQDHGFMVNRSIEDPDGHVWELMWMDPSGMPARG